MAKSPAPPKGELLPTPASRPLWRRGSWPLWVALVLWVLLLVKDAPGLFMDENGVPMLTFGGAAFAGLVLLLAIAIGVAAMAPGRLTSQHFGLVKPRLVDVVLCAALSIAAMYLLVWIGSKLGTPDQDINYTFGKNIVSDVLLVLGISAVGPVAEEFAYRGTLFRALADGSARFASPKTAGIIAIVVSSAVFSLAHTGAPPWHLLAYFAFGAILAFAYWWTGSLYVAITAHLLHNAYAATKTAIAGNADPIVIVVAIIGPVIGLALTYAISRVLPRAVAAPPAGA